MSRNNNENNDKVLPRGFMIPNVDNKEDYAYYKTRIFATVPEKTVLICKNKFTGNYSILNNGFKFIMPWIETKYVSLASRSIDYPKEVYKTNDGIEVTVDLAMNIRISDPIKYEINTQAPLTELGILAKDLMRLFVAKNQVDDFYMTRVNINNLDPDNRLVEFTERNGIQVEKIYIKNVELPATMIDDYEKQKEAEKKREIAKIEAEEIKIRAEANATADRIAGAAKAEIEAAKYKAIANAELAKIDLLIEALVKKGFDRNQIIDYLAKTIFAKEGTQVIANLNGKGIDNDTLATMKAVTKTINNTDNKSNEQSVSEQIEKQPVKAIVKRKK